MKVFFQVFSALVAITIAAAMAWNIGWGSSTTTSDSKNGVERLSASVAELYDRLTGKPPAGGASDKGGGPGAGKPGAFAMPVEGGPARSGVAMRQVMAIGTLLSSESVIIRPEISGRVAGIGFVEGRHVRKGQELVRLDDSVARAALTEAQANLALARVEAARAEELYRQGSGSAKIHDQAQARLLTSQAQVSAAQVRLEKLTLSAPFDGEIGLRRFSVGDYVREGQDMVNLEAIDTLKVDFRVPELYMSSLSLQQNVTIMVDSAAGRSFAGEVVAIDPLVDVNGRSVWLRAQIPNKDLALRPGLFARVALTLSTNANAVLVPEHALFSFGNDKFVYRVIDGKAKQTRVRIGERRDAHIEIAEGIAAGDIVIYAGHLKIRDGAPVTVVGPGGGVGSEAALKTTK
ncbi:membrane fusion protein, multidrug efflux system [Azospirillaceae bacterium]